MWRAGQATKHNMAHAHCILDNCGYRHTLRIRSIYCFSSATVVARARLYVMFTYTASLLNLQRRRKYLASTARSLVTIPTEPSRAHRIKRVFFNFPTILSGSRNNFMCLPNTDSHYLGKSIKRSIIFVIPCTGIAAMSAC